MRSPFESAMCIPLSRVYPPALISGRGDQISLIKSLDCLLVSAHSKGNAQQWRTDADLFACGLIVKISLDSRFYDVNVRKIWKAFSDFGYQI